MDTEDLTTALRAATEDVRPRPSFTDDVLRGAHRARTRHRRTLAGGTAVLVVALTAGAVAWSTGGRPEQAPARPPVAAPAPISFDGPTRGDLAGDQAYLAKVLAAWRQKIPTSPNRDLLSALTGEPHVYWAGTTPEGRMALVDQPGPSPAVSPALGLLHGDEPIVIQDVPPGGLARGERIGFLFGIGNLNALALGGTAYSSARFDVGADGRGTRTWTPMTDLDGMAFATLPEPSGTSGARLSGSPDLSQPIDAVATSEYSHNSTFAGQRSHLYGITADLRPYDGPPALVGGTTEPLLGADAVDSLRQAGIIDPLGYGEDFRWQAVADLPDGRVLRSFVLQQSGVGTRVYVMIVDRAGVVDWMTCLGAPSLDQETLFVDQVLPGGLGRLVARPGARLRHRTGAGPWVEAGVGAAIVPMTATALEFSGGSAAPRVIVF
ncbi:hypothetical protein [Actinokineospora spheciospongiae]|uniref:hypothetical protein n=1 Tax=Actinokineospora spheciospongiae TaxID=909613 RepID=UPI000D71068C|nr:hypothetical protein [Actinokineospora spheciospongiae]PWW55507.1 hypothetical protein DFQ13_112161 [Actinokineospora spheciospongiae]